MTVRWSDVPRDEWVTLNAKLRGVLAALDARGTFADPMPLGAAFLWVDATGDLRIKSTAPTTDLDGTVVGTQS